METYIAILIINGASFALGVIFGYMLKDAIKEIKEGGKKDE